MATRYDLAVDLLLVAARLGSERAATTDKDRCTVVTVTGAAALLLLELLGGTRHLAARQLRLGTGTTARLIGDDDLVDQGLLELTAEHFVRHVERLGANNIEFHGVSPQPLVVGRMMTSPPVAPGTAPFTAIR